MLTALTALAVVLSGPSPALQALAAGGNADIAGLGVFGVDPKSDKDVGGAIEIAKLTPKPRARPESFWIIETPEPFLVATLSTKGPSGVHARWADSRNCPALTSLPAALAANPGPDRREDALKSLEPCWSDTPPPI